VAGAAAVEALEIRWLLSVEINDTVTGDGGGDGGGSEPSITALTYPLANESNDDKAFAIASDAAGNTYLGGYELTQLNGFETPVVVKRESDGDVITYRLFEAPPAARVTSIVIDAGANVAYAGLVTSDGPGLARIDLSLAPTDPSAVFATTLGFAAASDGEAPTRVVLHPDGVVVAGTTHNGSQDDLFVGLFDGFGTQLWGIDINSPLPESPTDVRSVLDPSSGLTSDDTVGALLVLPDESILVGGMSDGAFVLAKYEPAFGTLVDGFGDSGIVVTEFDIDTDSFDSIRGLALQGGNRIVAAGRSDFQMAVARYLLNGSLDDGAVSGTELQTAGKVVLPFGTAEGVQGVAIDAVGNIVLGGTLIGDTSDDFLVVRLDAAGAIDTSFGTEGSMVHDFGVGRDTAMSLALDGDTILVAGSADASDGFPDMAWLRINPGDESGGGGGGGGGNVRILKITGDDNVNVITISADANNVYVQVQGDSTVHSFPIIAEGVPTLSRIVVDVLGGNDVVTVGPEVTIPAEMHGGADHDVLTGGSGDDVIFGDGGEDKVMGQAGNDVVNGGADADTVMGGEGRDIPIGGAGTDRIMGNADEDLLIAGTTSYDDDIESLEGIAAQWGGEGTYNARVAAMSSLLAHVFDDNAADTLWGNGGLDWFLCNTLGTGVLDRITELKPGETASDL
jgi:Ca2+-binding RTX toxin-like protein